ncbi:S-adenosyl-L-methionine-dependent methyltransferase [Colletotrichum caudatum]|nr:S-adenosyl-L-methionine-dependent methyltransferase [Colletotrichum caudatum]
MADNQNDTAPNNGVEPANDPALGSGPVIVADDHASNHAETQQSLASSSTSVTSSIFRHRLENGWTYHKLKDGKYAYSNDQKEKDRLDLQHDIYLLTLDYKLGLAPPNDDNSGIRRVLDIGAGTGLWAIDFGESHPEAEVLDVDLPPVQTQFVPPNVRFEVEDVEEPWLYSRPFDYKFLKQTSDGLVPGGYVEAFEGNFRPGCDDGTLTSEHAISKWVDHIEECGRIFRRLYIDIPSLVSLLKEVGFVDVTDAHYIELGSWCLENLMGGLEAFSMAPFTRTLGWTKDEVIVFLIDVRKELRDRGIHAYNPM